MKPRPTASMSEAITASWRSKATACSPKARPDRRRTPKLMPAITDISAHGDHFGDGTRRRSWFGAVVSSNPSA
jgi:hypothetical protein